jgi:manganese oxidase
MTLTGHFLGGVDYMLRSFRTARFLFGLLAVLSLLLLPSLSPYRTMAFPGFLDPTSADKADDDHGGGSSSLDIASTNESPTGPTTSSSSSSSDSAGPKSPSVQDYDKLKNCSQDTGKQPTSIEYLTYFNCGHVKTDPSPGGEKQVTREFTLIVKENQSVPIANHGLTFDNAWTFNGTIPGPTMRVTEGDVVKINVINGKENSHPHSLHLHSVHPASMDGMEGPGGQIMPGQSYTYSFVAQPHGVYPYHCHVTPLDQHINKGLYGMFIIDPKTPRPHMVEMAMMMNGYDLDYEKEGVGPSRIPTPEEVRDDYMPQEFEHTNEVYTVNGRAFDYMDHPIQLQRGVDYRIYLVNMLEFDPVNSFHMHGNMFNYYPGGTSTEESYLNDIVTLGQGDRGIMEFKFGLDGRYMFHSHVNEFSELGWMGVFDVKGDGG